MGQRVQARLVVARREVYLGRWPSQRAADIARDRATLHLKLERPLRYPKEALRLGPASPAQLMSEARTLEKAGTSSQFSGVLWDSRTESWRVSFKAKGRRYNFTGIAEEEAAAVVRDRLALYLLGQGAPLNFPKRRLKPASFADLQSELRAMRTASKYRGVAHDSTVQRFKWTAQIMLDGESVFLGRFPTEEAAALAYDRAARRYLGKKAKLNLAAVSLKLSPADEKQLRTEARAEFKKLTKSRFRGVAPSSSLWAARIGHRGKQHYLGTFVSDEEAAEAYDKAAVRLHGKRAKLNFDPETGDEVARQASTARLATAASRDGRARKRSKLHRARRP